MTNRFLRLALLLAISVFVAGCASSIARRTADGRLSVDIPVNGKSGYVLVKVVSTRPISLLNPKWQQVVLMSTTGVRHELADVTPPSIGVFGDSAVRTESLHFGELPPGEYEFDNAGSIGPGPGVLLALMMSDHASLDKRVPRFRVEAGRLTDLGTIVYSPSITGKDSARIVILGGPEGTAESLRALVDDSGKTTLPATGGGWLQPPGPEAEAVAQGRALVSMLTIPTDEQHNGQLVAGSHLGEVVQRLGPGNWTSEPLPGLIRITFAARWRDGSWVAGGEFGRYATKKPNGPWLMFQLPNERGQVVGIHQLPDGQALLLINDDLKGVRALVQSRLGDEVTLSRILPLKMEADEARLPVSLLDHPEALLIARNIPGFRREVVIARIDKKSLAVTTTRENFFVHQWQTLSNGNILVTRMNGLTSYLTSSADAGKTWVHTERVLPQATYWVDAQQGYSIKPTPGFSTVSNQVARTSDGGSTWTPMGQPFDSRDFAAQIVYVDDREILARGGHLIFSSLDAGKTWALSFPRAVAPTIADAAPRK